jgi:hypothetical protein
VDSATEVEGALKEIEGSELARNCLAVDRMRQAWQALRHEVNQHSTHQAVTILTRGIMAGLYLAGLEQAR